MKLPATCPLYMLHQIWITPFTQLIQRWENTMSTYASFFFSIWTFVCNITFCMLKLNWYTSLNITLKLMSLISVQWVKLYKRGTYSTISIFWFWCVAISKSHSTHCQLSAFSADFFADHAYLEEKMTVRMLPTSEKFYMYISKTDKWKMRKQRKREVRL